MLRRKQNMWPFGSSPKKRVRRSEAELAQIAAEHKAAESGYFGSRSGSRSSRATGGSGRGTASRSARGTTYQGYSIKRTEDGDYVIPRLDADSHFDSLSDAKAFLRSWKENGCPMKKLNPAKFDRCVREVKAKGGAYDPYAVCTAAGTRNPSLPPRWDIEDLQDGNWQIVGTVRAGSAKEAVSRYRGEHAEWSKGRKIRARIPRQGNPPQEAAAAYQDFHGRGSEETVTVKKEIHYHATWPPPASWKSSKSISRPGYKVIAVRIQGCAAVLQRKTDSALR